jgi:uncharacterized protein involved in exopolysaccharide biosynthesis
MIPAEELSTQGTSIQDSLGGLSGLASGLGVMTNEVNRATSNIEILKSRKFIQDFIESEDLVQILRDDKKNPSLFDAYLLFQDEVLSVNQNKVSGIITLSIDWTDAELSAEWANKIVLKFNNSQQNRAREESSRKIEFLSLKLLEVKESSLLKMLSYYLSQEINNEMLSQTQDEYSFEILNPALVPEDRYWPRRSQILITGLFVGFLLSLLMIFIRKVNKSI